MKQTLFAIVIATFMMGCRTSNDAANSKTVGKSQSITRVCAQRNAAEAKTPDGFKVTPAQAIEKAKPFFISNPFELLVYANGQDYYVDAAIDRLTQGRLRDRSVKISGQTGEVLRGEERTFGK